MEFEIRTAALSDSAAIAEISRNDLGYAECSDLLVEQNLRMSLENPREKVFVAVSGELVAGYIHIESYQCLYSEKLGNILGLAVRGNCQRKGIGKKLLIAAEDWAKQQKLTGIRLNSSAFRTGAHEFYRSQGFLSVKQQIRFIKMFD